MGGGVKETEGWTEAWRKRMMGQPQEQASHPLVSGRGHSRSAKQLSGHRIVSAPMGWDSLHVKYEPQLSATPKNSGRFVGMEEASWMPI